MTNSLVSIHLKTDYNYICKIGLVFMHVAQTVYSAFRISQQNSNPR